MDRLPTPVFLGFPYGSAGTEMFIESLLYYCSIRCTWTPSLNPQDSPISVSQFSASVVSDSATPWFAAHQASLSTTNSWSLSKLMPIELVMPSSHLILCHPLLLLPPSPPSIRVFSNESTLRIRWPKYWSFSFSISPSNEHPGLISFRMDWLDLLAVQGLLRFLHSLTLTSIHDHWKNYSLD